MKYIIWILIISFICAISYKSNLSMSNISAPVVSNLLFKTKLLWNLLNRLEGNLCRNFVICSIQTLQAPEDFWASKLADHILVLCQIGASWLADLQTASRRTPAQIGQHLAPGGLPAAVVAKPNYHDRPPPNRLPQKESERKQVELYWGPDLWCCMVSRKHVIVWQVVNPACTAWAVNEARGYLPFFKVQAFGGSGPLRLQNPST